MTKTAILFCAAMSVSSAAFAYDLHTKELTPIVEKSAPAGAPMAFVEGGRLNFALVADLCAEARTKTRTRKSVAPALELLAEAFEKTAGTRPEVVDVSDRSAVARCRYAIVVGDCDLARQAGVDVRKMPEQGFSVATFPQGIVLAGFDSSLLEGWNLDPFERRGASTGTYYAALDFCERFLGVRWFFPGPYGTLWPAVKDLTVSPVRYDDAPWFNYRGARWYYEGTIRNEKDFAAIAPLLGEIDKKEAIQFTDRWRVGGSAPPGGGHSPSPELFAKTYPDRLRTIFYTSPSGKFWYNPSAHIGNYFNVVDLKFADLLVDAYKAYVGSRGKNDPGFRIGNSTFLSFGVCDTYMPYPEMASDPVVKELGLMTPADIAAGKDAAMRNVYGRFYHYLGNRLKQELPEQKLYLLVYYNSTCAPTDPRWKLPDNIEIYFCARDLPLYTRDERRMAETRRMLQEWYDALGGRPAQRVWLYNSRSNPFARAVAPEFIGDIPRLFGKLVGREGGLFFDFDGRRFIWNNYYSAYAGCKSQWNPDFDVDAAIDAHWSQFYGPAAGPHLKRFHDLLKECFVKYFVPADASTVAYPPAAIDEMERCLKMTESALRPGSVEMHRFRLLADRWPEALASQRALAAYRPPVYDVPRSDAAAKPFDLVDPCGSPTAPSHGGDLRLSWDDRALHGRFVSYFAAKGGVEKDFWQSDRIELFFSPGLKKGLKHLVAFDANGRIYSERQRLRPIPQPVEKEWRPEGAKVRAARGVDSWSLDFTIPFSAFEDGAPKPNDEWNFNFVCTKASEPQSVAGTALTGGNHHNLDMYGVLRFVGAGAAAAETSVAPVPGPFGSSVKVRCADGRWMLRAARTDGPEPDVFEVRIDMASEAMSAPPELIVEWSMPQNDMHALWSMRGGGRALGIRPDWSGGFVSQMNQDLPVYALMDANDGNRLTVAADDPVNVVRFKAGVHEETCETACRWTFFSEPVPPATNVSIRLRFDARRVFWADAVRDAAQWVADASGAAPANTPESARAALYSTWYAFHQEVSAEALEEELAIAASLGMKTVIVDDGWQTDDNRRGYAFCGDWNVSTNKFPDMKAHVERVHGLGMKFMLWYGVPVVGEKSANMERLRKFALKPRGGGVVLDPRFPEVREFLIGKWEAAVRDWDVDGFKLDFLCNMRGGDPAREGDGRDIADLHEAIARLLGDATGRLREMKPDLLVEFREDYIGPAMRRYGNMMRVEDCPADMARNRRGIANLRMVCGNAAVHSDMLEWCLDEPPESAARQIINSIFGTIQYSVRLGRLPKGHLDMLRHWTRFARDHEETLQRGTFRPHRPAFGFPVIEAETSYERIIAAYEPDTVVRAGLPSKPVYLLNATGEDEMVVDLQKAPTGAILFDACGRIAGRPSPTAGLSRLRVPPGGYARLDFSPRAPRLSSDGNGTLVDGCWMWGHDSGVYDGSDGKGGLKYGIPGSEPISMAAAVERFGVPNVCVIRWGDPPDVFRPQPPTDGYLAQFGRLERFGWAIANNKDPVYAQMRSFVPGLVGKCPNMTAFDLDDFFRAHKPPTSIATDAGQRMSLPGALSYAEMKELKALAKSAPHPVDVRMTLYTKDLCAEIMPLAELADSVILWTWDGSALDGLEDKFAQYRAYLPQTPTWLGIYMWDFGGRRPLEASFMERQLDIAKRLFLAGEIRGCVFHCTPLVNKGLEAVERCREWLRECGGLRRAP